MSDTFLDAVSARQTLLTRSEAKVASWILSNPSRAVSKPVQAVAESAQVSEPTVIRFCRSMGLDGFRDLKTQLITSLHKADSYLHDGVDAQDSAESAATKVLESSIDALVELRRQIFTMPFEAAAARLASARQVVFIGSGASGHVATDACHKFFRLGIPCTTALDSPTILQQAAVCQPDDVLVVVSHSGTSGDLMDAMRIATTRRGQVFAVTDPASPLAEIATILFPCHANEDTNVYTPQSSRLAQLTLLDALQVTVALSMGERAEENLRSSKAAIALGRIGEQEA